MALKQIKNKIKATEKTRKVTKAMEAVSAVKMRKSQERALGDRAYAEAALRILQKISRSFDIADSEYMREIKSEKEAVVVITSDKGLAGNLNSAVLKELGEGCKEKKSEDIYAVCLGKKGYEQCVRSGYEIEYQSINLSDDVSIEDLRETTKHVIDLYVSGKVDRVRVVFQEFESTFNQNAVMRQILPLDRGVIDEMIKGIVPKEGKFSDEEIKEGNIPYTIEPDAESVLSVLMPQLVEIMIFHALLEAKASEHSARMVAMKNASDKALEVSKLLTLKFNKERQAVITREVSEITGGIEAMASK